MRTKEKKGHRKDSAREVDEKIASVERKPKMRSMIEFDTEYACSIKALGVKENNQIKPTARFFSGKMLMFAKLSLKSFIYDLAETFVFPNAREYQRNLCQKRY